MRPLITEEQSDEYAKNWGGNCPFCGSSQLDGVGSLEIDGGEIWQEIECLDCDARWDDIYKLVGCDNQFRRRE
jgi:hypothetical protein